MTMIELGLLGQTCKHVCVCEGIKNAVLISNSFWLHAILFSATCSTVILHRNCSLVFAEHDITACLNLPDGCIMYAAKTPRKFWSMMLHLTVNNVQSLIFIFFSCRSAGGGVRCAALPVDRWIGASGLCSAEEGACVGSTLSSTSMRKHMSFHVCLWSV